MDKRDKIICVSLFAVTIILIIFNNTDFFFEKNGFKKNVIKGLPNYSPISIYEAWQVAVVGNGPISENDRRMINSCQCIIRFNDAKNRRPNERTDVQIVRRKLAFGRVDRMFWKYYVPKGVYTMYISEKRTELDPVPNISFTGLENLIGSLDVGTRGSQFRDDTVLFEGCDKCNNKACKYSLTGNGPSSGGIVIDTLDSLDNIKEIHIFGMNWTSQSHILNHPEGHIDFKYPDLVKQCCKKCVFHKTPTNDYIDPSFRTEEEKDYDKLKKRIFK